MKTIYRLFTSVFFVGLVTVAMAADVPDDKQTKLGLYVTATEAADMISKENALLVDVRSRAEVGFLGMPTLAVHIPYMVMPMMADYNAEKARYELELNPDFPTDIAALVEQRGLSKDSPIILMCRSGKRSSRAADLLTDMGFTNVYSVIDGFEGDKVKEGETKGQRLVNGWKNAGLPWSYKISPEQVYSADR